MNFAPTALLVMKHNKTGLKYFCKTTRIESMHKYYGSGIRWQRHLKKHGKDIDVDVLGFYFDKDACTSAAIKFSEDNNIAKDRNWANMIYENGLDGAGPGEANHRYGKPHPNKGKPRPEMVGVLVGEKNGMYGKPSPMRGVPKPKGIHSPLYGRKRPEGGGKKPRPVVRIEDNVVFDSVASAANACKGSRSGITKCCNGKANTAHGYTWKYLEA